MKPGTSGFVGDRLREAREARGLTGPALADLLGISRQAISAYENAYATPAPEIAQRLSTVLNLPLRFFLDATVAEDPSPIYWRSRAAATKTVRERSQRRYNWLRRIVGFLGEYVAFPELRLPPGLVVTDPAEITDAQVDEAAKLARLFFGLGGGAIENMTWLLENHGVIVGYSDLSAETLDSFSQRCKDGRAFAIVNLDHGSSVRYRFDLAHELGHLVLHRNITSSHFAHHARNAYMEDQAHRFAREFLMPSRVFAKNFYSTSIDGLKVMKRMWGVSMQAVLMHATDLNLVSKVQAQKLWRGLSVRGWRRREPFDDSIPCEEPALLRSAFAEILSRGVTVDAILEALPYTAREIEVLCGLEPGTLEPQRPSDDVFDLSSIARRRTSPPVVTRRDRVAQPAVPPATMRRDRQSPEGETVVAFGRDRRDRD